VVDIGFGAVARELAKKGFLKKCFKRLEKVVKGFRRLTAAPAG